METEQESSQPKSLSKSYRRRQRRKEAASLRKQISEVVLEKEEYSIQTQDKQSEANKKVATENTVTVLSSKDTNEPIPPQFGSQGINTKKLKKLSNNINEDIDTHEEKLLETEKPSNISRSKRRRNRKKALLCAALGNELKENNEIKEGPPFTFASKTGVLHNLHHVCSQENCVSGRDCLTRPNKFTCRDCESVLPSSRNNLEKSIVIEKNCKTCQNSCIDAEKKDFCKEENIKVKTDATVDQKLNQITKEKKYKKRKACGNLEELIDYIEGCDVNESSGAFELKRKIGKSEDIPTIPSNSEVDSSEKQSKPSLVFQQTNINSNTSESNCSVTFDCLPVVTENIIKAVVVESAESEMKKTEVKPENQSQGSSSTNKNDSCKNKVVSGMVTDNLNQKVTSKVCEKGKEEAEKQGSGSANKNDSCKNKKDKVSSLMVTDNLNQKVPSKVCEKVEKDGKGNTEKQSPDLGSASKSDLVKGKNDEVDYVMVTDNLNWKATPTVCEKVEKDGRGKTEKQSPASKSDLVKGKNDEVDYVMVTDNLNWKVTPTVCEKVEKDGKEKTEKQSPDLGSASKSDLLKGKNDEVDSVMVTDNLNWKATPTVCEKVKKDGKGKTEKQSPDLGSASKSDLLKGKNDEVDSVMVTDNLNRKVTPTVCEKVEKDGKGNTEKQSPDLGSASKSDLLKGKNDEVDSVMVTDNLNWKATPTVCEKVKKDGKGKTEKQSPDLGSASKSDLLKGKNDEVDSVMVTDNLNWKVSPMVCEKVEKEDLEKSKEQVKAEREARKAEKMAKKQKKVIPPNVKEINEAAVCIPHGEHEAVEDEAEEDNTVVNTEADLATKPIQNTELNVSTKSKAELRAERRAKQEAQRAAKAAAASANLSSPIQIKAKTIDSTNISKVPVDYNKVTEVKEVLNKGKMMRREQGAKLLSRLGWEDSRSKKWSENTLQDTQLIHPAIVQLGTRFTDRIISGSNARCIAFVQAIKKAIQDYQTPPQKELGRDLEARLLAPSLTYLESQRPHAVSVSNATRFLKWQLTQLQPLQLCSSDSKSKKVLPDEEAKHNLIEGLDSYIWEKIEVAEQAVCDTLRDKIKDGDVILTYGCSYLLQQILIGAKRANTKFKVVVVDGRPWREGREMLRCLVAMGIPCSYVLLSAASSVMRQVNKVLLGAHALLSNGYVMSRVGVSQVALLASAHNVPVLVACETHKFCERVQSDSFVYNEMGEPDGLAQLLGGEDGPLSGWRTLPCLSLLNLSYDVTPPELVTAVATELAVLPCTSVPVVLRVRPTEPVTSRH